MTFLAPRRTAWLAGLVFACLSTSFPLRAESLGQSPPPLPEPLASTVAETPAERELFAQAAAGKLAVADLFRAALIAGGATETERTSCQARFRATVEQVQQRLRVVGTTAAEPEARAAVVHATLHELILKGDYDLGCSRLTQAFRTGKYNCVTATVLFNSLAAEAGLETAAGETPAHVVSLVKTPKGSLPVETTCHRWFELRAARPPADDAPPPARFDRELGVPQLVALVYYNVGVDLAEERRFAEAVAANYKALRLDPASRNARANLLAAINNGALELAEQAEFGRAIELMDQGRRFAPDHPTFAVNDLALRERWVRWLFQRGLWSEADDVLQRVSAEYPSHLYFSAARRQLEEHRSWTGE